MSDIQSGRGSGIADPIDVTVGANIRAFRERANMNQSDLGKAIGLTFQQVQKYEKGTNRVSCSKLIHISRALGCHPVELLPVEGNVAHDDSSDKRVLIQFVATPGAVDIARAYVGTTKKDRIVFARVADAFLPPAP